MLPNGQPDDHREQQQRGNRQHAPFGAHRAAGKPAGAAGRAGKEVVRGDVAAIGYAIEERFSPVPGNVAADGPPQGTAPAQAVGEDQPGKHRIADAENLFAAIANVTGSEEDGQRDRCRPESDSLRKSKERIAAHEQFLEETDEDESQPQTEAPEQEVAPVQNRRPEVIDARRNQRAHEQAQHPEACCSAEQKVAKPVDPAQSKAGQRLLVDARHNPHRREEIKQKQTFAECACPLAPKDALQWRLQQQRARQREDGQHGNEQRKSPAGAKPVRTDKDPHRQRTVGRLGRFLIRHGKRVA